jgi:hypothetical protein
LFCKLRDMTEFLNEHLSPPSGGGGGGRLSEQSLLKLRLKVLHASGDAARCDDSEEEVIANQVCSMAVNIATNVSQFLFFQKAFMVVLEQLEGIEEIQQKIHKAEEEEEEEEEVIIKEEDREKMEQTRETRKEGKGSNARQDWKSRSGRTTGPDHYQYGDVTRAIFTTKRSWGEKVF